MWQDWKNPKVLGFGAAVALIAVASTVLIMKVQLTAPMPSVPIDASAATASTTRGGHFPTNEDARASVQTVDFGNGVVFRRIALADYQREYPNSCFAAGEVQNCMLFAPQTKDCPSSQPCTEVAYIFRGGYLYKFTAEYDKKSWSQIFGATKAKYGPATLVYDPPQPQKHIRISSHSWTWTIQGLALTLMDIEGQDNSEHPETFHVIVDVPGERDQEDYTYDQGRSSGGNTATDTHMIYAKDDLRRKVIGKSMSDVRSILGTPSNVTEMSYDHVIIWYYWDRDLTVTDPDSGTKATSTAITFSITTKTAIQVRYP